MPPLILVKYASIFVTKAPEGVMVDGRWGRSIRVEGATAQHARLQQSARWVHEKLYILAACKLGNARVQLSAHHHSAG